MRVLVTTAPMVGHFFPMVSLCWALRSAGHQVLVASPESFAPTVRDCGLTASGAIPAVALPALISRDRNGRPIQAVYDTRERLRRSGAGWARVAAASLDATTALVRDFRPDLIVTEPLEFAGQLAADRLGVPRVEHGWGLRPSSLFISAAQEELRPELDRYRLAGLPAPELLLDVCPPSFQQPGVVPAALQRYVPFNGARPRPGWLDAPRHRPRVFVTFGTLLPQLNPTQTMPLLRFLIERLPELGVEVLVGVAPQTAAQLPPSRCGASRAGWLPLDQVLPLCDLVIHYGGSGTTMTALTYGVPQIVLAAAIADAPDNATRVADTGIGVEVAPEAAMRHEPVRDACQLLLADPGYGARAGALAADNAALPTPAQVVTQLERLA